MALVLIVDDEPDTLLLLRINLEAAGHRTVLAADADTALTCLAGRAFDLVLVDIMMPVHDGWTVLEALGVQPRPPAVLVVSGRAGPVALDRAERLGTSGYLAAPFTSEQLDRAVERALAGPGC